MGIVKVKEKVRNGYLGDLPQDVQTSVMNIHKIIKDAADDLLNDSNYSDLSESSWAMSCIDEFCAMPKDKSDIGSFRVYKGRNGKKNTYRCIIQISGKFRNHQYGWIEELLHEFFLNMYSTVRTVIRKKYDMTLVNDGKNSNAYEGYTLQMNSKYVEPIWESLNDRKTLTVKESYESIDLTDMLIKYYESRTIMPFDEFVYAYEHNNNVRESRSWDNISSILESIIAKDEEDSELIIEATNEANDVNTSGMSEAEAKKTLRSLSQQIIDSVNNNKDYKVSQYTANIYANIITKNLLPNWSKGYHRVSITLDSYQSMHTFEFKVPHMTQDFVSRLINGRESINGFLHRVPEIKIKMSPRIFHTMKSPDDAYNFFKCAIKYYDTVIDKTSDKLLAEALKMNHELKHLVSTTKLSGIVTYPLSLLFVFNDVQMSNKDTFKISKDDIAAVNKFVKGIYTKYASPEKEKKQIVSDIAELVKELKECMEMNETLKDLNYLSEALNNYYFGHYDDEINRLNAHWLKEQYDTEWVYKHKDPEIKLLQEKFGVKKLKRIPMDTIAYIQIETESIRDANDKMMIASYCLSKLEIVEWYIELIDVGSKKYIVPHNREYLVTMRTQLLECYKKIMDTPVPKGKRPIITVNYPDGYDG